MMESLSRNLTSEGTPHHFAACGSLAASPSAGPTHGEEVTEEWAAHGGIERLPSRGWKVQWQGPGLVGAF